MEKKVPPARLFHVQELSDEPTAKIPKNPRTYNFPEKCPQNCSRNCNRVFAISTKTISFAVYVAPEGSIARNQFCIYGFSCGMEINGALYMQHTGEPLSDLVNRLIPELLHDFQETAILERENFGDRNQ